MVKYLDQFVILEIKNYSVHAEQSKTKWGVGLVGSISHCWNTLTELLKSVDTPQAFKPPV